MSLSSNELRNDLSDPFDVSCRCFWAGAVPSPLVERETLITGRLRSLFLYEVSEGIDVDALRVIVRTDPGGREPAFRHPAPEYVRYEKPSALESLGSRKIAADTEAEARIRYFEYGVASVELRIPFEGSWNQLISFAVRWIGSAECEATATASLRDCLKRIGPALRKPHQSDFISEDYYVIQIDPIRTNEGRELPAQTLLEQCGEEIAQIV